jgi:hypothetical protein
MASCCFHGSTDDVGVLEILSDEKPGDTQRSRRTRIFILFYFTLVVPDALILKILGLQQ